MGADLLANEPVFAATIAEVEPLIARESGFSVTEAMTAPEVVTGEIDLRARRRGPQRRACRCATAQSQRSRPRLRSHKIRSPRSFLTELSRLTWVYPMLVVFRRGRNSVSEVSRPIGPTTTRVR